MKSSNIQPIPDFRMSSNREPKDTMRLSNVGFGNKHKNRAINNCIILLALLCRIRARASSNSRYIFTTNTITLFYKFCITHSSFNLAVSKIKFVQFNKLGLYGMEQKEHCQRED